MCAKKAAEQIEVPTAEQHVINDLILCELCTTTNCQISYANWKSNLFICNNSASRQVGTVKDVALTGSMKAELHFRPVELLFIFVKREYIGH